MRILIINGPNLQATGKREPEIYGMRTFDDFLPYLGQESGVEIAYFQTNHEGLIIDKLYEAASMDVVGIVLNAGAYTHTSIAIADAIRAIDLPVVEVHLSNTVKRESYRHESFLTPHCVGVIMGFGLYGYVLAVRALADQATK